MCLAPDKESEKIVGDAITGYKKKNAKKWLLQRQFEINKFYEMVSSEEIDTIFKTEGIAGWKTFYERHPDSGGLDRAFSRGVQSFKDHRGCVRGRLFLSNRQQL